MIRLITISVFALSLLAAGALSRQNTLPSDTLAVIGTQVITAREFVERMELMPWPGKDRPGDHDSSKVRALKALVAEKLLAQEAAVAGIGQDSAWHLRRAMLERMIVRDELYRREVSSRAAVTEDDLRRGLASLPRKLDILFLRAGTEDVSQRLSRLLRTGPDPDSLLRAAPPGLLPRPDTVAIAFGSVDFELEDSVFALSAGRRVSGPVRSTILGWGVAVLLSERLNPEWAGKSVPDRVRHVEQIIKARRRDERADQVAGSILGPQRAEANPTLFERLAGVLLPRLRADSADRRTRGGFRLSTADCDAAETAMSDVSTALFVRYASGGMTVRELLASLKQQPTVFPALEEERFKDYLNAAVKRIVASDLISREAYRRNLHQTTEVRQDLATWEDHWAAAEMMRRITSGVAVSEEDALQYLAQHGSEPGRAYEVNIREVLTDSLADALEVVREVTAGGDMAAIARTRSRRRGWNMRGGESGYFNVGAYPLLGFPALYRPEGAVAGPLRVPEGYSVFTPLGKRLADGGGPVNGLDSLLASGRIGAAGEKARQAVLARVDSLAREAGVRLDLDRLRSITILPSNMVTQRFIGFGGAMIAVPTILPVWQWLYSPPGDTPGVPL